MGTLELITLVVTVLVAVAGLIVLTAVLRHAPRSEAGQLVGQGEFADALESADVGAEAERDELLAAAIAAKHLGDFERSRALTERVLTLDHDDGEAWLELGLSAAYSGDAERALEALYEAGRRRADLLESISLHRAWVELQAQDAVAARRRFEEISAPIESKLRSDLGPGDPLFAEWFFQAADLWEESGALEKSAWARREARRSAPNSPLVERLTRETG